MLAAAVWAAALAEFSCWICFFLRGSVRRPLADFRFFFEIESSLSLVAAGTAPAAEFVGDDEVGDLPIPSDNNAAMASPSSEDFSGVGAGDLAAPVLLVTAASSLTAAVPFVGVVVAPAFAGFGAAAAAEAAALEGAAKPAKGDGAVIARRLLSPGFA